VVDTASEDEHVEAAEDGLRLAADSLLKQPFLLVMDEVLNAVSEGLVESKRVIELLGNRGDTHIILTGRGASGEMVQMVDLVTECKKVKHPYDEGKLAVRGLDF
jgi:cob(I)alamin adenosyltransferase